MIVDGGALQTFAGGEKMLFASASRAELLMMGGAFRPGSAPVVIRRDRAGHLLEIGEHDAVGDEARAPNAKSRPVSMGSDDMDISLVSGELVGISRRAGTTA